MNFENGNTYRVSSTTEELLDEWVEDLGSSSITMRLAALRRATTGSATFRARTGGTEGLADGTVRATVASAGSSFAAAEDSSTFTPAGLTLIKLTGQVTAGGNVGEVRGAVISVPETGGGGGDSTPPVIQNVAPTPGDLAGTLAAARLTPVEFDVVDTTPGLRAVVLTLKYHSHTETLVVHNGTSFVYPFDSATSLRTSITNGYHYLVLPRAPGWDDAFDLRVYAVDQAGNLEGSLP